MKARMSSNEELVNEDSYEGTADDWEWEDEESKKVLE
jgi:hypothetical protein